MSSFYDEVKLTKTENILIELLKTNLKFVYHDFIKDFDTFILIVDSRTGNKIIKFLEEAEAEKK